MRSICACRRASETITQPRAPLLVASTAARYHFSFGPASLMPRSLTGPRGAW